MKMSTKKLGELVTIRKGRKAPEVYDSQINGAKRYLQISDLRGEGEPRFAVDPKGVLSNEKDVIIAWDGANAGTVGFGLEGYIGSTLTILRLKNENVDTAYLGRYLQSRFSYLNELTTGATIPHIDRSRLEGLLIPRPPLPEQRRITAILDKGDAIRRKRQKAIRLTDEFLRSAFLDMFGDPAANPKEWETKPIKKIGKVVTGNTPSRKKQEYYGDHIEWIKSNNINTPFHFLTEAEEYLSQQGKQVGRSVPAYSILVSCIAGTPECIGNAALSDREVAFNQQINAIVPFKYTDPYFLYSQLLVAKKLVQRESTNSMKGLVSKTKFEKIKLLIPPKEKQNKFREIFMEYLTLHERQTKLQMESDFLFNSLSQRAFRGEL